VTLAHRAAITLCCDHRILYGGMAARFLQEIKTRMEEVTL
jgi:pyruvate/2-oxoglutarate dehydrogenase complex dihydrolipoamide acyltransferase (E2) component